MAIKTTTLKTREEHVENLDNFIDRSYPPDQRALVRSIIVQAFESGQIQGMGYSEKKRNYVIGGPGRRAASELLAARGLTRDTRTKYDQNWSAAAQINMDEPKTVRLRHEFRGFETRVDDIFSTEETRVIKTDALSPEKAKEHIVYLRKNPETIISPTSAMKGYHVPANKLSKLTLQTSCNPMGYCARDIAEIIEELYLVPTTAEFKKP